MIKNCLAYLKFNAIEFLEQFTIRIKMHVIFQKGVDSFEIEFKTC